MAQLTVQLSQTQKEVVTSPIDIPLQVLASAGSGKTRVLTERILHILSATKKESVLALTFTNKAAEEMVERLSGSNVDNDRVWIGTIHSVAQRILDQYGHTIGLPSNVQIYERDKDRMEVFLESLRDDGVDIDSYLNIDDGSEKKTRERNLQTYMDAFSTIKREMLTEHDVVSLFPNSPGVWKVYEDYQEALLNSGGIDYDDILRYAHRILTTQDWIGDIYRAKYRHVCVDEAQDLNRIQYEFIKSFVGKAISSVMMVGDPDQMIYGFNGSSSKFLVDAFVADFNPVCFSLKENFRSTKAIVRIANRLRPGSQIESEYALEGKVSVDSFQNETLEAEGILERIKQLIECGQHPEIEGVISVDKMVVIARNRFVFAKLEEALGASSIPYNLRVGERRAGPTSLFGKVLDFGIRLKLNPRYWVDGRKLCQLLDIPTPEIWTDENVLASLARVSSSETASPLRNVIVDLLHAVNGLNADSPNILKLERDFKVKLEALAGDSNEGDMLELERSLEELSELSSSWTKFRTLGYGTTLLAFQNAKSLGKLGDSATTNGLTLSTVHNMKGLEKDIVFIIGLCEGVFPDYRATTKVKLDEERNTAFVAFTRARRWLFLSYPEERVMPWGAVKRQSASRFISEIAGA